MCIYVCTCTFFFFFWNTSHVSHIMSHITPPHSPSGSWGWCDYHHSAAAGTTFKSMVWTGWLIKFPDVLMTFPDFTKTIQPEGKIFHLLHNKEELKQVYKVATLFLKPRAGNVAWKICIIITIRRWLLFFFQLWRALSSDGVQLKLNISLLPATQQVELTDYIPAAHQVLCSTGKCCLNDPS